MKANLVLPAAWGRQNEARPIVKDEQGEFICEGFYDESCQERLQLMIDQSNKYSELAAAIERLAKSHPSLQVEI